MPYITAVRIFKKIIFIIFMKINLEIFLCRRKGNKQKDKDLENNYWFFK